MDDYKDRWMGGCKEAREKGWMIIRINGRMGGWMHGIKAG
jgi:hypothetical protein